MRLSTFILPSLLGAALAHEENLLPAEIERRSTLSSRCEASAANFNKKRYEHRVSKRWAGSGNTTYQIHAEAPYYETIQNDTCVLSPILTEGPYVWPRSETLRQDMTEDQEGVPVWLDIGVLNMATCEPLKDVLLSFWHCNATGSYSSFTGLDPNTDFVELLSELGRNVGDFEIGVTDLHTDDTTWLRGMWPTDAHGMMEMKTVFPGFYAGRAIHIHVQAHTDWTLHDNGTVSAGNIVSTGQLFFNETVSAQIMSLEPYASHTQINRTMNSVDSIFSYDGGYNPVVSVVPADGVDIRNGMIGYITIGVDTTAHGVDNSQ
ncbi:hypothetical protein E8E14_011067 [Neopestalotiopsis sp. 37M]|nr:hypothetical protein E8E14_011067 [Neopestalotiopsis sp. 37M]